MTFLEAAKLAKQGKTLTTTAIGLLLMKNASVGSAAEQ